MADLSVLIAARNEIWLKDTIEDVLAHARADTEVICVLDGAWPDPAIPDHPRVRLVYRPEAIGQRAAINYAARLSTGRYVMKLDAHCSVAEGFDVTLMADCDRDWTVIPQMRNLHAFNRRCRSCGHEMYQGPMTRVSCEKCQAVDGFDLVRVWQPRNGTRTECWRFDHELHFQYMNRKTPALDYSRRPEFKGDLVDTMTSVGACFFMHRERFWELGGLDETHGSWGQFGVEVALKSALSGGRHVVNRKTWFAHMFRTQGGDFGFPYAISTREQEAARIYSRDLWLHNRWPGQVKPLSWWIDRFAPVSDWHEPHGAEALARVREAGERFGKGPSVIVPAGQSKGLVYYSDGKPDGALLEAVRAQLHRAAPDLPSVSVTLKPMAPMGPRDTVLVKDWERGYIAMFRQILAGLEALDTEVAFLVEHDLLYHPSHFDFTPPRRDVFYYNQHTWKVDAATGQALHYRCSQTSGLCADRALLVAHYRARVAHVEAHGFERNLGFEPGTNRRSRALDPHGAETWWSVLPNIDIRHGVNLTKSRWSPDEFRDKRTCEGWTMADEVPGWGRTKGRFAAFLAELGQRERAA